MISGDMLQTRLSGGESDHRPIRERGARGSCRAEPDSSIGSKFYRPHEEDGWSPIFVNNLMINYTSSSVGGGVLKPYRTIEQDLHNHKAARGLTKASTCPGAGFRCGLIRPG